MRCYMGSSDDRLGPLPIEALMETTIKLFRSVKSEATDLGVKIAIENHSGDMQARETRTVIEESGKDFVGSCLDTGNPIWAIEDPFLTLEILAPYAVTTHVRDSIVFETPHGAAGQWVAMGDGILDLPRFVAEFRKRCPQSTMQLEIITGRPPRPLNYLDADFLEGLPQDAGLGICPLRRAGQERPSLPGRDGGGRRRGQEGGGDGRGPQGAAAGGPGAQLRILPQDAERGSQLAGVKASGRYSL